ncbi:hypothetical protein FOZ60_012636 [Perkinsus olseni]|uniref:Uncharacterized protein n=1 Tax=Perkinsus olseni TaxID=32597 RepID=A0A7J6NC56_PEROL|nr:hypothetical protein FOZ60_012636 [Perkinsus olseni]
MAKEKAKYFLKFWPKVAVAATGVALLILSSTTREIQQELGVSKKWERSNAEVMAVQQGASHENGDQDYIANSVGTETWVLNLKPEQFESRLRIYESSRLSRSRADVAFTEGALSDARQARMLAGERTLCPYSTGSQKFGYIQVSPLTKYFYAAIQADKDPGTAPTFMYFEGGPGGSSLTAALRMNGPCIRDYDTGNLRLNQYSWTGQANGVWIDAPAPTGFSVGPATQGFEDFILDMISKMTADLQQCDTQIGQCNSNGPGKPPISAFCKRAVDTCDRATLLPLVDKGISHYDVRVPSGQEKTKYVLKSRPVDKFLNDQKIQKELGVSKKWQPTNSEVYNAYNKYTAYDTTYFVTSLLDKGLKVLVMNGDQDYISNIGGTETWVLNLKGADKYGEKLRGVLKTEFSNNTSSLIQAALLC